MIEVFSARTGERVCELVFVPASPVALETAGPEVPGEVRIEGAEGTIVLAMSVHFSRPHPMRVREGDGQLVDVEVPAGTFGHFGLRVEALQTIGYSVKAMRPAPRKARAPSK